MLEKLYDICYDLSDILLSLLIISIIFFVISWKISDSLELNQLPLSTNIEISSSENIAPTDSTNPTIATEPDITVINNDEPSTEVPTTNTEVPVNVNTKPDIPQLSTGEQSFTISSGATGSAIADQLYQAGIITSKQNFISRLDERGLSSKLQIGTYTLSSEMTIDEVINKLTRQ